MKFDEEQEPDHTEATKSAGYTFNPKHTWKGGNFALNFFFCG